MRQLSYPNLASRHRTHKAALSQTVRSSPGASIVSPAVGLADLPGAVLIPTNPDHSILKIPWSRPYLQIGRGPFNMARNDIVMREKRISNVHCRITLGLQGENGSGASSSTVKSWKDGEGEPDVWVEDLGSSNGSFVGARFAPSDPLGQRREGQDAKDAATRRRAVSGTRSYHGQSRRALHIPFRRTAWLQSRGNWEYCWTGSSRGGLRQVSNTGSVSHRPSKADDSLGKGSFAEVRKAVDVETGDLRAIKVSRHRSAADDSKLSSIALLVMQRPSPCFSARLTYVRDWNM